jgi:hypothetical protein
MPKFYIVFTILAVLAAYSYLNRPAPAPSCEEARKSMYDARQRLMASTMTECDGNTLCMSEVITLNRQLAAFERAALESRGCK